jgi:4-hydroxybenzoate polyprenyltransferase
MSLFGLALTVYGVIVPTEIRDYFGDKAMSIETFTVKIGLVQASALAIYLLSVGSALIFLGFLLEFLYTSYWYLAIVLAAIPIAVTFVLIQLKKLYSLSKEYSANSNVSLENEIVNLSARNPQWIMIVTQTLSAISIILLLSKFVL